ALVERFPDERAGHVRLLAVGQRRTERRVAGGRVDLAQLDLIDAEFLRGLREDRLHDADALRPARRALRRLWRRVGQHREAAPPHRLGLIRERHRRAGRTRIALRVVRTVVADRVHVDREDLAVLAEADLRAGEDARTRAA